MSPHRPLVVLPILVACSLTASPVPAPAAAQAQEAPARAAFDHTHAAWTEILRSCVHDDGFDYGALKQDALRLERYLDTLHAATPDEQLHWTDKQRFAFWINCYNAHTVQKVVQNYPLKSIRKLDKALGLKTVFEQGFIPMRAFHPDGKDQDLALNDIEHGILRRKFKDARLHAAINCASASCPALRNEAFVAERLDEQLDEQMRAFVRDGKRNRFLRDKDRLELSEIFSWFREDFERDAGSVKDYVARFAAPEDAEFVRKAKVSTLDYDWDLNDVPKR
jgi:hypothetical protein